jgi:general secretion pathway protein C
LTVGAFLCARIVNNTLEVRLIEAGAVPLEIALPAPEAAPDPRALADARARTIADRNLFNAHPPVPGTPADDDDAPEPEARLPGPDDDCPTANLGAALVGTVVAHPEAYSMALVQDGGPQARVVKVGDPLKDAIVAAIYRHRVVVHRGAQYVCLSTEAPRRAWFGAWSAPPPPPPPSDDHHGVQRLGRHRYRVDRESLDEQVADLHALGNQVRLRPYTKDGRPDGFELSFVQSGGLFDALGLSVGDVVTRINGEDISSPNKALRLFDQLPQTREVTLEIERGGRPVTLEYTIQ